MSKECIKIIAEALKENFRQTVSANSAAFNEGSAIPFEKLDVALVIPVGNMTVKDLEKLYKVPQNA